MSVEMGVQMGEGKGVVKGVRVDVGMGVRGCVGVSVSFGVGFSVGFSVGLNLGSWTVTSAAPIHLRARHVGTGLFEVNFVATVYPHCQCKHYHFKEAISSNCCNAFPLP